MEHHGQGGPELSPAQQTQRHSNQNPAPDLSRSVDRGLERNGFLGLRIPSTMYSDDAWRAGHHAAALPAWIGFVAITVAAIIGLVFVNSDSGSVTISIVVGAIFLVTLIWAVSVASLAARSTEVVD